MSDYVQKSPSTNLKTGLWAIGVVVAALCVPFLGLVVALLVKFTRADLDVKRNAILFVGGVSALLSVLHVLALSQ